MDKFFKFPHTPHLIWLAEKQPRNDKVLPQDEVDEFLRSKLVVEEKVDGANIGISLDEQGDIRIQNRGGYLKRNGHFQFKPLWPWIIRHKTTITDALYPDLILFGEWCYAKHSVYYDRLPDWFLAFDVYDKSRNEFWCTKKRNIFIDSLGLERVPELAEGLFSKLELLSFLGNSRLTDSPREGIYLRKENDEILLSRAKIVNADFVQNISEHWMSKGLIKNSVPVKI